MSRSTTTLRSRLRFARRLFTYGWLVVLGVAFVTGVFADPASADNCSVFTDCFGQSGAASEAALGLTWLAAFSLAIDFIPIVGDVKGLVEMATGRDLLTGEELAPWERALGLIGLIPGGDLLRLAGVGADAAGAFGSAIRAADNVGDLGGGGRGLGGVGPARGGTIGGTPSALPPLPNPNRLPGDVGRAPGHGAGTGAGTGRGVDAGFEIPAGSHRADIDRAVEAYQTATRSQRTKLSEQIGESGGADYLEHVTGRELPITRPLADGDVTDLIAKANNGEAWDTVVAYNGRNVTNLVYFDGEILHVIEAKGGAGTYGTRVSKIVAPEVVDGVRTRRISQTNPEYPKDIAFDMGRSPQADGRNMVGNLIMNEYRFGRIRYVSVRTAGHEAGGVAKTILEAIFRLPGS